MTLQNKVALITGGASGIGYATAERFLSDGAKVMIVDISEDRAKAAADALAIEGFGESVAAIAADVSIFTEVEAAVRHTVATFGMLDIIFNNAGIAGGKPLLEHDPATDYDPMIRINQNGVYYGILAAGRQFRTQGTPGVIINTASIYGEQAADLSFTYSAAKAAVISFTRSAAFELADYNVRAVAIIPGRVGTAIINQFDDNLKRVFAREQLRNSLTAPEEVANVVAFLASDNANSINGTVVHVDDGYSVFKQRLDISGA
jgi:NAD(P)-dependent dehydrogenase (short-subunit alcohol dehydrogenase family)